MRPRVLVAGIGNIFLADDGFGVEVARRLAAAQLPPWVRVADFGIRGVHLAYELANGYDAATLIDAMPRGGEPGTVYVIEVDLNDPAATGVPGAALPLDAHGMEPAAVFALLKRLDGHLNRVLIVGCEPAEIEERIGLSEPVARAVEQAIAVVQDLIGEMASEAVAMNGVAQGRLSQGG